MEGSTLRRLLRQEAPLTPLRTIDIVLQICASLAEAHGKNIIHRDLKPSNVMVTPQEGGGEFVKVLDFGLAKLVREDADDHTKTGLLVGSPKYMSPEQVSGSVVDARSDVYSVGTILYSMLTGRPPFEGANSVAILMAHLNQAPSPLREREPRCEASDTLEWVVLTCLAKQPLQRFASIKELAFALEKCREEIVEGQLTTPLDVTLAQRRQALGVPTSDFSEVPARSGSFTPPRAAPTACRPVALARGRPAIPLLPPRPVTSSPRPPGPSPVVARCGGGAAPGAGLAVGGELRGAWRGRRR